MIIEAESGTSIYNAAENAAKQLRVSGVTNGTLIFNNKSISISFDSNSSDIATIYALMHKIDRLKAGYKD